MDLMGVGDGLCSVLHRQTSRWCIATNAVSFQEKRTVEKDSCLRNDTLTVTTHCL